MDKTNVARDLLWPKDTNILVRIAFLYVGQGSSTIVLVADGNSYKTLLVDINLDPKNGGIDVPSLISDLVGKDGLDVFINTHPHDDHLKGITEISRNVEIKEVWHSGHRPGRKYDACYQDLRKVIEKVKMKGKVTILEGSREQKTFGEASYYVLAPAEYVSLDINKEDPDERKERIHEQCAVLKFGIGSTWVMIPGDADRDAFEKYITKYHEERLGAVILAAPHHGSRSFFKYEEEDEPYLGGLKAINPDYVVISAPKQEESQHQHPHEDAIELYANQVGADNILHSGEKRYSYICDIYREGDYSGVEDDKGALVEAYPLQNGDDERGGKKEAVRGPAIAVRTRVDDRPMGRM